MKSSKPQRRDEIDDKRAYEEACVEQVIHAFSGKNEQQWLAETHRALQGVELEGEFPHTELVVTMHDQRMGRSRDRRFRYRIWGEDTQIHGRGSDLQAEPNLMAANIFMWTMEE